MLMPDLKDIKIEKLVFKFNPSEKEITVDIPIISGEKATLISKQTSATYFEMKFEINGEEKFFFKINKIITGIGKNTNCKYHHILKTNMEKYDLIPAYIGGCDKFNENFSEFVINLQTAHGHVEEIINSPEWKGKSEEEKPSWAEVSGSIEKFSPEDIAKGEEILKNGNLIEEILDLAELKAVGQRDNTALVTLIALSSFLEDSIHHISTGPPGTSKSTITDAVYEVFPLQRKESIGKGSTPASLSNMTIYKEGPRVLSRKFIRIGDLGNDEEIKAALSLLSVFKELMSDKKYDKTISIAQGDTHVTKRLKIEGIGSIHLSTIESNVESQYDSRAIISSPDNTLETANKIKEHQLDDFKLHLKTKKFNRRRPVIAAAIELICRQMEYMEREYGTIKFTNPYAFHMNEVFGIDTSRNVNRDRNHIRDLPKSVTLSNIKQRDIWVHKDDGDALVLISPEDYLSALKMISTPILKMLSDISPQQQSYLRFISENYVIREDGKPYELYSYDYYESKSSSFSSDGWIERTKLDVCFTKKDIIKGLRVSSTSAARMLEDFVEKKIVYKRLIGKKNFYFPTNEFFHYSKSYSPELFTGDDLDEGGKVHKMAVEEYRKAQNTLSKAGYEKKGTI